MGKNRRSHKDNNNQNNNTNNNNNNNTNNSNNNNNNANSSNNSTSNRSKSGSSNSNSNSNSNVEEKSDIYMKKQSSHKSGKSNTYMDADNNNNNSNNTNKNNNNNTNSSEDEGQGHGWMDFFHTELSSVGRIMICSIIGMLLGFGVGSGHLTGAYGKPSPWRKALGSRIRSTLFYDILFSVDSNGNHHHHNHNRHHNHHHHNQYHSSIGDSYTYSNTYSNSNPNSGNVYGNNMNMNIHTSPKSWIPFWNTFAFTFTFAFGWFSTDDFTDSITNLKTEGLGTGMYDSSHPMIFAALRESIIREEGGYVHPDLGILTPAPCGASRGLGMVRNSYQECQTHCFPGTIAVAPAVPIIPSDLSSSDLDLSSDLSSLSDLDKDNHKHKHKHMKYDHDHNHDLDENNHNHKHNHNHMNYRMDDNYNNRTFAPQEVLLKVPLASQLTRTVALQTLLPLLPHEVRHRLPLEDLDDAILLALLLAHERGRNRESRFQAYISTLPSNPTCGYSSLQRNNAMDVVRAYRLELGLDVDGWPAEITKASDYAERIAGSLARDYGNYITVPMGTSPFTLIQWALCVVASHATAGNDKYGSLRLIPIVDLINHDEDAGEILELKGGETVEHGDFMDASEDDAGAIIVRSMRHLRPKHLKSGQELLINYNVPHYSPLDWFINLGFIPIERAVRWTKLDNALPRASRRQYADNNAGTGTISGGRSAGSGLSAQEQSRPEL